MNSHSTLITKCINYIKNKINNLILQLLLNQYQNNIPLSQLKLIEIYNENKQLNDLLNVYKSNPSYDSLTLLIYACRHENIDII
eukprot:jgi/Orpsp1_1/1174980/evm.model.c7180000052209.1